MSISPFVISETNDIHAVNTDFTYANPYYFQAALILDLDIKQKHILCYCICLPGKRGHREIIFSHQLCVVSQFHLSPTFFSFLSF